LTPFRKELIAVRHRAAALVSSILAIAVGALVLPSPAAAVVDGFNVKIVQLPGEFDAGANAGTVLAVVSADQDKRCQKVRWSMVLHLDGVDLDQVRVNRVEADASFAVRVQEVDDETARLTDVQFDPGVLCAGRTVTARYDVAFTGDADGDVTFEAQALDAGTRLLQSASATSRVVNAGAPAAKPKPTESKAEEATPTPEPAESAAAGDDPTAGLPGDDATAGLPGDDAQSEAAAAPDETTPNDLSANPASKADNIPSLLGPGLIIGAILVFLGVGLLLRLRMRNKDPKDRPQQHQMPTGFYPSQ
jgi:hypothetical protein